MLKDGLDGKKRCFGGTKAGSILTAYHDNEWGIASHDDQYLFEMLILEGAQAGLNWETVLNKRECYRKCFYNFDFLKVASMMDSDLEILLGEKGIVRNRLKIFSARKNAQVFIKIIEQFGSFEAYIWRFVNGDPIINSWKNTEEIPVSTVESDAISKDLKKRGMSFVGSTIIYAYMQAIGMVNDHLIECWCYGR